MGSFYNLSYPLSLTVMFHDTSVSYGPLCDSHWFFSQVVTLLKSTSPIQPSSELDFLSQIGEDSLMRSKQAAELLVALTVCVFFPPLDSPIWWTASVTRISTSHPSLRRLCQTTCCPLTFLTMRPPDCTSPWSRPARPQGTTTCRAAWPSARMEPPGSAKTARRSAQTAGLWPARFLWWVEPHPHRVSLCWRATWKLIRIYFGLFLQ